MHFQTLSPFFRPGSHPHRGHRNGAEATGFDLALVGLIVLRNMDHTRLLQNRRDAASGRTTTDLGLTCEALRQRPSQLTSARMPRFGPLRLSSNSNF